MVAQAFSLQRRDSSRRLRNLAGL